MATQKLDGELTGVPSPLDQSKELKFENEEEEVPSPGFGLQDLSLEPSGKTRKLVLGRKRNSEWVFRPLRVKFKVKELEQLYKIAVYRQQQSLLFSVCVLIAFVSLIDLLVFLGNLKVCIQFQDHTQILGVPFVHENWAAIP